MVYAQSDKTKDTQIVRLSEEDTRLCRGSESPRRLGGRFD